MFNLHVFVLFMVLMVHMPLQVIAEDEELFSFSNRKEQALIVKVTNADQVILENGKRIKLIGVEAIGAPKRKYVERDKNGLVIEVPEDVLIPMEEQALAFAQELMEGKKVIIESDQQSLDSQNRRLAYVFLEDGTLANEELLRQGFVQLRIQPPNIKYAERLREAYRQAKKEQRGALAD